MVNTTWHRLNWLQRSAASWLHLFRCLERPVSSNGHLHRWLLQNACFAAWLLVPAVLVMPAVSLVLWQLSTWLALLTSIAGRLIVLPILILLALVVIRIVVALFKR